MLEQVAVLCFKALTYFPSTHPFIYSAGQPNIQTGQEIRHSTGLLTAVHYRPQGTLGCVELFMKPPVVMAPAKAAVGLYVESAVQFMPSQNILMPFLIPASYLRLYDVCVFTREFLS
jgi:hypothetical protein